MYKEVKLTGTIFVILLLILSVIAGVYLVSQSQDIRNKAFVDQTQVVSICHRTGFTDKPYENLQVPINQLNSYINSGDTVGVCFIPPVSVSPVPKK